MATPACTFLWNLGRSRIFLLLTILVLIVTVLFQLVDVRALQNDIIQLKQPEIHLETNTIDIQYLKKDHETLDVPVRNDAGRNVLEALADVPNDAVNSSGKCKKKMNVSFLKVHKAGSTTLMNIFLRFAQRHRLNIVLPNKSEGFGFNYLGYGKTVSKDRIVPLPADQVYNILCNHVVYNKAAFRSIMPVDTSYVGILREPKSHFISAGSYYGFFKTLNSSIPISVQNHSSAISEYLKNPKSFNVPTYFVHNRMAFDFGISPSLFNNRNFVASYIQEIAEDYQLIMIMEKFYESLVLLRRSLCWDTKDILFLPLNARGGKLKPVLTPEDINHLQDWNSADFQFYDYFSRVFENKMAAHGSDLVEEVDSFKQIQNSVKAYCDSLRTNRKHPVPVLNIPATKWGDSFTVATKDCQQMSEPELTTMKRLINEAWERYNETLKTQTTARTSKL